MASHTLATCGSHWKHMECKKGQQSKKVLLVAPVTMYQEK